MSRVRSIGLRTKGVRIVDVDSEQLWKASVHDELAPSFARWFDGFVSAGCEAFGVRASSRPDGNERGRRARRSRAGNEACRSARRACHGRAEAGRVRRHAAAHGPSLDGRDHRPHPFMVIAVGFIVTAGRWDPGMAIRAVIALLLLVYCVKRVLASRHVIEIDDEGILDSATRKARIPWNAIADITCETSRDGGTLVVTLKGPRPETVRIDLDGVRTPIQTIVSSAIAYLQAAKEPVVDQAPPAQD